MSAPTSFPPLSADTDVDRVTTVESLCMQCHQQGETRLLLTHIPYYQDVILMSFSCPHCHHRSSEIQSAIEIQEQAHTLTLRVDHTDTTHTHADLNRQIIKTESCTLSIPELELEIPPSKQSRGEINTVEGILTNIADSLSVSQASRLSNGEGGEESKSTYNKIADIIEQLRQMAAGERGFTLILDDLSGNSFIENPYAPHADPRVVIHKYARTAEQTEQLGYAQPYTQPATALAQSIAPAFTNTITTAAGAAASGAVSGFTVSPAVHSSIDSFFNLSSRSACLTGECPVCHHLDSATTRICVTEIPHFKDVIIMNTECSLCGYRDTEVKPSGHISGQAARMSLTVNTIDDLKRDLLKSDTSAISIPELELEMDRGTLGGKYTTIEGILNDMRTQLQSVHAFHTGDSATAATPTTAPTDVDAPPSTHVLFTQFLQKLDACLAGTMPFTFVLDDPLGNSHIFSPYNSIESDPNMIIYKYDRTWEQNEELGLNDVNVEAVHYLENEADKQVFEAELRKDKEYAQTHPEEVRQNVSDQLLEREMTKRGMKESKVGGLIAVEETEHEEEEERVKDTTETAGCGS